MSFDDSFKNFSRLILFINVLQELDSKAPLFREQREFYEKSLEEINRLQLQNNLLSDDRQKLQIARDSISRELLFTRAELERYQHEHQALTLQVCFSMCLMCSVCAWLMHSVKFFRIFVNHLQQVFISL